MDDPTQYWPREWREDFTIQNQLLEGAGDELLHPREYLQCRYDDTREVREQDEVVRAERHHEVLLLVLKVQAEQEAQADTISENAAACVSAAKRWADLAYPKVEVKP
jgi:hypothetical protein